VQWLFIDDRAMGRRVGQYLCWRHTGLKRREIGADSAVTPASRRVAEEMEQSESMRKAVDMLEGEL
jgi:hypothetical protein